MDFVKCKRCGNKYDKGTKICPNCKYPIEKMRTRKILIIYGILATIFLLICLSISSIMSYSSERNEMKKVSSFIESNYDFDSAYKKVSQLSEKQQKKGYKQILSSIDKKIEKIKQGTEDKKLEKMLNSISPTQLQMEKFKDEINKRKKIANTYNAYIRAKESLAKEDYKTAYIEMNQMDNIDENLHAEVTQKMQEIREKAESQLLVELQEKMEQEKYDSVISSIKKGFISTENLEIKKIYEDAKTGLEKQKQEEQERKEEEKKKAEEEAEKATKTVSSDDVWCEAYGCARKKADGDPHYCSVHRENPDATTPVASPKKENNSQYSNYHKCEYPGCSNYASQTKYCSKHTTYKKCAKKGCNNRVSYEGATYCAQHAVESYYSR